MATLVEHTSGVVHHSFFLQSSDERVHAALYAPALRPRLGLVVCPAWGAEAVHMLEWCHRFARTVLFVAPETVPKASSGKAQRLAASDKYASGELTPNR